MLVNSFATGTQRTLELSVTLLIIFHYLDPKAIFATVNNCPRPQLTAIHWLQWVGLMLVISLATGTQRTLKLSCTLLIIIHYLDPQATVHYLWSTGSPSFDRNFACCLTGESMHLCNLCISAIIAINNQAKRQGFESSTSTDCKFIDFSGWDWCLWSAWLLATQCSAYVAIGCTLLIIFHYPLLSGSTSCDQLSPPSFDRAFACRLTGETCIFALLKLH